VKHRLRQRFRLLATGQVLLLLATLTLLAWSVLEPAYVAVPVVLGLVAMLQVAVLLRSVESHIDALTDFFSAINFEDFTRRYIEDDVDGELKEAFNRVIERFQDARAERDVQAGYLETVVRHVPVPFIAARADGSLSLVNNPARRLTGLSSLHSLEQLAEVEPSLPARLMALEPGSQQLIQSRLKGVPAELRVAVSEIRLKGGTERLFSIENLSGELNAREFAAWRNLIRVLTHEIMNTLTPITSLAQTTAGMVEDTAANVDIREAVQTIARRSEGLTNFVLRYRELLKVPVPDVAEVNVQDTLQSIVTLMRAGLEGVDVRVDVTPASLSVRADRTLLDQVLVNVVKNALEAFGETAVPRLELSARLEFGRVVITISDSGPGIDADTIDQVFVPFFTTRRQGSGIGLSLCRQIMTAHGGEIALESDAGGTRVKLIF
jgi:nitrogen fixation/metabolism regulation signal transduction histidine kinase